MGFAVVGSTGSAVEVVSRRGDTMFRTRGVLCSSPAPCVTDQKQPISRYFDGETRTRTGDTTIFSRVLYQLSYLAAVGQGSATAVSPGPRR